MNPKEGETKWDRKTKKGGRKKAGEADDRMVKSAERGFSMGVGHLKVIIITPLICVQHGTH